MNEAGLLQFVGAGGAWTGIIIAFMTYLHTRRKSEQEERARVIDDRVNSNNAILTSQIKALQNQIEAGLEKDNDDHTALQAQVSDIARSVTQNYMPRREVENLLKQIQEMITEARKDIGALRNEIGAVHGRIDQIYRSGWRRDAD